MLIARHGGLRWESARDDAGPYLLASRWHVFARFGSRAVGVGRPGSLRQVEAFEISRAAFDSIRLCTDATSDAADLSSWVRIAAEAARAEYDRWPELRTAKDTANFQAAVDRRFIRQLDALKDVT